MFTTYRTRLANGPVTPALDALGALQGHIERRLHAAAQAGRPWRSDLQSGFYRQFGVSSVFLCLLERD